MNKSVCQFCFVSRGIIWTPHEEDLWYRGELIRCPVGIHGHSSLARPTGMFWWCGPAEEALPPRGCSLIMEHVVLSQEEEK